MTDDSSDKLYQAIVKAEDTQFRQSLIERNKAEMTYRLTPQEVKERIELVRDVMKNVMEAGAHYEQYPGMDKPMIKKEGAEILGQTFNIRPQYEVKITEFDNYHREYLVKVRLFKVSYGEDHFLVGEGDGSCSTLESNYRYVSEVKPVNIPVPSNYWTLFKKDRKQAFDLLPKNHRVKKVDGEWRVVKAADKVENPNIPDTWNNVLKKAKKRAYVAAILTYTCATDIFLLGNGDDDPDENQVPKRTSPSSNNGNKPGTKKDDVEDANYEEDPGFNLTPDQLQSPKFMKDFVFKLKSISDVESFRKYYSMDISMLGTEAEGVLEMCDYKIFKLTKEK